MRRAAPATGLSPQLIKHFAIATVSITALLALFASGEEWGASAQIEAVEAKNRLAATQAEKLGTAKLESKLKVRRRDGGSMSMGGDGGGDGGGGGGFIGGGDGGGSGRALPRAPALPPPPRALDGTELTPSADAMEEQKRNKRRPLTESEREALLAASSARSGAADSDDF